MIGVCESPSSLVEITSISSDVRERRDMDKRLQSHQNVQIKNANGEGIQTPNISKPISLKREHKIREKTGLCRKTKGTDCLLTGGPTFRQLDVNAPHLPFRNFNRNSSLKSEFPLFSHSFLCQLIFFSVKSRKI